MFSNTSNNALVLTRLVFSDRSYWACHLAKVCIIQGQYFLGGWIGLGTVEQTRQRLEVAVKLFHSDKELMYRNPIGLF